MSPRRAVLAAALIAAATATSALGAASARADSVGTSCTLKATGEARPCSGWFPGDVSVVWTAQGAVEESTCPLAQSVTTEGVTPIQCTVKISGTIYPAGVTIRIDKTPPTVTTATARAPDVAGWFNRAVTVSFSGSDALSGVASCTTATYAGPDAPAATVTGTCTDAAGLTSAPFAFGLRYDATPPALSLRGTPADRLAELSWSASEDATAIRVVRTPGRRGQASTVLYRGARKLFNDRGLVNGRTYEYSITASDAAGNTVRRRVTVRPGVRLLSPLRGARVSGPPVLRWTRVAGARYYNVQLFRVVRGRLHKVHSSWPANARLRLASTWRYGGVSRRLAPGRYRWYVWPGLGARSERRFGPPVGNATFSVVGGGR